jgi:hypothetical protein
MNGIQSNYILAENWQPGTDQWQITHPALNHEIEGYASQSAVANGETLTLYVSTSAPSITADVFRMGWYGGNGARRMMSFWLPGMLQSQPTLDSRRTVRANWQPTFSFIIPADWASGGYLVKLTSTPYEGTGGTMVGPLEQYIFFVVDGSTSDTDILFQCSAFTYQAYNAWGGYSLYHGPGGGGDDANRSYAVSFGRPYLDAYGSAEFLAFEYPLIRWLERHGYDVSYTASEVVHDHPERLTLHRAFLSVGHDEYWSLNIRNGVESARDHGTSVAFFGSNAAFWRVRVEADAGSGACIVVCYKDSALDPISNAPDTTNAWRADPYPRPEDALIGQMYESWFEQYPYFPMICQTTDHWIYTVTGAEDATAIPGIVGYEYDRVFRGYQPAPPCQPAPPHSGPPPANLEILAASPVVDVNGCQSISNVTVYELPNGAVVFSAGTNGWSWGLDDLDPGVCVSWWVHSVASTIIQGMTVNLLRRFRGESVISGRLWHTIRNAEGGWSGLGDVEGNFAIPGPLAAVSATSDGVAGETQFMFTTADGHLWHTIRNAEGGWSGLGDVEGNFAIPGPVAAVSATSDGVAGETQFMFTT